VRAKLAQGAHGNFYDSLIDSLGLPLPHKRNESSAGMGLSGSRGARVPPLMRENYIGDGKFTSTSYINSKIKQRELPASFAQLVITAYKPDAD
jgi:hypothetical protein